MTDDQKAPSASVATGNDLTPGSWADFVARLRHDCVGKGVEDHYTADAIFVVQARRRIYGIDSDYTDKQCVVFDGTCWHSPEEYWGDLEDHEKRELDEKADDEFGSAFMSLDERDQWICLADLPEHTVTGWDETWEYVNSHFTKDAAEAFIRRKKHDYRDGLRVYVDAQLYCCEYNTIKSAILDGRIGLVSAPATLEETNPAARLAVMGDITTLEPDGEEQHHPMALLVELDDPKQLRSAIEQGWVRFEFSDRSGGEHG